MSWEWENESGQRAMRRKSAEIRSSSREDYKCSEKEINNGVNYAAANTAIRILKTFSPCSSLYAVLLECSLSF